jgi:peptidoglycan hydrolase FlgJ
MELTQTNRSVVATAARDPKELAKLNEAAKGFEAIMLRQMIGAMRQASLGEDILGNKAGSMFRDMYDGQLADSYAAQGSLGLAQQIVQQFEASLPAAKPITEPGQ